MKSQDVAAHVLAKAMGCAVSATAGGAGDNAELTGEAIDLLGAESCEAVIPFKAALGAGESLAFTLKVEESDDGSSFGAAETIANAVTVASSVAGGTIEDVYRKEVRVANVLAGVGGAPRKRYIRFKLTPNLSRANTDTVILAGSVNLGVRQKPATSWAAATA